MASASPCGSSSQPTPGPSATPSGPAEAQVYVAPDKDQVAVGDTVVVTLRQLRQRGELDGGRLLFRPDAAPGRLGRPDERWPGAAINIARKNVLQAIIDRANSGVGIMQGIGVNIPPQGAEASVSGSFLTITMKAVKDGTSTLSAANVSAIDLTGANEAVPPAGATLVIKSAGTTGATNGGGFSLNLDWPLAISAAILTVELFALSPGPPSARPDAEAQPAAPAEPAVRGVDGARARAGALVCRLHRDRRGQRVTRL